MLFKKAAPKLKAHNRTKVNKENNVTRCGNCLELSTFRVFKSNGVNMVACVMCLTSCRYQKWKKLDEQKIAIKGKLKFKDIIRRQWLRTKVFFLGNHIWYSFKIRRRTIAAYKEGFKNVFTRKKAEKNRNTLRTRRF